MSVRKLVNSSASDLLSSVSKPQPKSAGQILGESLKSTAIHVAYTSGAAVPESASMRRTIMNGKLAIELLSANKEIKDTYKDIEKQYRSFITENKVTEFVEKDGKVETREVGANLMNAKHRDIIRKETEAAYEKFKKETEGLRKGQTLTDEQMKEKGFSKEEIANIHKREKLDEFEASADKFSKAKGKRKASIKRVKSRLVQGAIRGSIGSNQTGAAFMSFYFITKNVVRNAKSIARAARKVGKSIRERHKVNKEKRAVRRTERKNMRAAKKEARKNVYKSGKKGINAAAGTGSKGAQAAGTAAKKGVRKKGAKRAVKGKGPWNKLAQSRFAKKIMNSKLMKLVGKAGLAGKIAQIGAAILSKIDTGNGAGSFLWVLIFIVFVIFAAFIALLFIVILAAAAIIGLALPLIALLLLIMLIASFIAGLIAKVQNAVDEKFFIITPTLVHERAEDLYQYEIEMYEKLSGMNGDIMTPGTNPLRELNVRGNNEKMGTDSKDFKDVNLATKGLDNNFSYTSPKLTHYDNYKVTYVDGETTSSFLVSNVKDILAMQDTLIMYAKQEIAKKNREKQEAMAEAEAASAESSVGSEAAADGSQEKGKEEKKDKGTKLSAAAFLIMENLRTDTVEIEYVEGDDPTHITTCSEDIFRKLRDLNVNPAIPEEEASKLTGCSNPYLFSGVNDGKKVGTIEGVTSVEDANQVCRVVVNSYEFDGGKAYTYWEHNDTSDELSNAYHWQYFATENAKVKDVSGYELPLRKATEFPNGIPHGVGDVIHEYPFSNYWDGYAIYHNTPTLNVIWNPDADGGACYQVSFPHGDFIDMEARYLDHNDYPDAFHLEWSEQHHSYVYQTIKCYGHKTAGNLSEDEMNATHAVRYGLIRTGVSDVLDKQWVCGGHIDLVTKVHVHRLEGDMLEKVLEHHDDRLNEAIENVKILVTGNDGEYVNIHRQGLEILEEMKASGKSIWEEGSWAKIAETKAETYYSGAYDKMDSYEFTFNGEKHKMDDIKSGEQKDIEVVVETEDETGEKKKEYKTISLKAR